MFTCPEKDIHSIYLDGELPEHFAKEYEAHISSCAKCQAELKKLRFLHEIFAEDASSLDLDKAFLDQSFERLQGRMRFKKIVSASEPKKHIVRLQSFIPAAAAAAAVFAIMVPLKLRSPNNAQTSAEVLPVISKAQSIKPIAKLDVFVEGEMQNVALRGETNEQNGKSLALKASNFEILKQEEADNGMTIRLTDLSTLNSISASNVSYDRIETPDFLK